jgi:hypothetical protein
MKSKLCAYISIISPHETIQNKKKTIQNVIEKLHTIFPYNCVDIFLYFTFKFKKI